jgi:sialic acid synthase SpsE
VGFSSHLKGSDLEPIAVAIGANLIEKHFTLDQNDTELAEHHVSLDPIEFKKMVDKIRRAETALGIAGRGMSPEEYTNRDLARRSVVAENEIEKGAVIRSEDLVLIRPGTGIPPKEMKNIIGKIATRNIVAHKLIEKEDFE